MGLEQQHTVAGVRPQVSSEIMYTCCSLLNTHSGLTILDVLDRPLEVGENLATFLHAIYMSSATWNIE